MADQVQANTAGEEQNINSKLDASGEGELIASDLDLQAFNR
jgi:hypothetical protein